ncbi:hypothetical protein [Kribbella sp. DT2]|uniref:hypothetical protein n=1 Tax=Kribbella sp. DT2 TaxID=3393427 RepID=UPI003CF421ED
MLSHVDTWVLDLDNTLYPPSTGLADQMNTRIREYLSTLYAVDEPTARDLQAQLVADRGTTLRGLMNTMGVDGVFDVLAAGLVPKPFPDSYRQFLERFEVVPGRAALFDDLAVNLTAFLYSLTAPAVRPWTM